MKESKINKQIARLNNNYLVLKNFLALSFFYLALLILTPLRNDSDILKVFLAIYATIVIFLSVGLIVEFIIKTVRLQIDKKVKRYASIVSLNGFFGLVLPIFIINDSLYRIMYDFLKPIRHAGTFWCDVRFGLIDIYEQYFVFNQLANLAFLTLLILIAMFLIGGLWERTLRIKN